MVLSEEEKENIKADILFKLLKRGNIGGSHTSFDNLPKGFPPHKRNKVKEVAELLINDNIILSHPTGYGREVTINPEMLKYIINLPKIIEKTKDSFILQRYRKFL